MFLKSEEDDKRPLKKKYHFDMTKVIIGFVVGYVTPEIARFLSEKVIANDTLVSISNVSQIGLAFIFAIIMLFVTFRVELIYEEDEKVTGEQNEITDKLSEYHEAKKLGQKDKMLEIEAWLKDNGVTLKK